LRRTFPLEEANPALEELRDSKFAGTAVLVVNKD